METMSSIAGALNLDGRRLDPRNAKAHICEMSEKCAEMVP